MTEPDAPATGCGEVPYQTNEATGPVLLNDVLTALATPVLPVPVAVAVNVRFEPVAAVHPLKVKIPPDEEGVQVSAVPVLVIFTEIEPA
jgi:hypothetical protein